MSGFTHLAVNGLSFEVDTDVIEVTTCAPSRDPKWSYTDPAGHVHRYIEKEVRGRTEYVYPDSIKWVEDEPEVCDCCGHEEDGGGGHWECVECGAHVKPGLTFPGHRREFLSGRSRYSINGTAVTKEVFEREVKLASKGEPSELPEGFGKSETISYGVEEGTS